MAKEKIELTLQDESGQEYIAYPFVESEDVTLSNGTDIETMIAQDVSMPIVTHEETSFKVGVGDSDISNSIVDSSVANITIKGQTYQNILPDPTLRNSMTDGKTMQKLNEGYESVNTVDGVCKSAILSGQTLVNIRTDRTYGNILNASWIFQLPLENKNIIKPSTKYFALIFNDTSEEKRVSLRLDPFVNDAPITIQPNSKGCIISETKSTITSIGILLNRANHTLNNDMRLVLLEYQEGMENWDIPYFEGMQSVEAPSVTTVGKNLFDIDKLSGGTITTFNGKKVYEYVDNATNFRFKGSFKDNTQYTFAYKFYRNEGELKNTDIRFEYSDGTEVKYNAIVNYLSAFTSEKGKTLIGIKGAFNHGKGVYIDLEETQLEESPTATTYEPYKTNILHTPEEVVLRSLPNGVCDTLNLMTGEYVKRIGEIVLNGSESWASHSNEVVGDTTVYRYRVNISDMLVTDQLGETPRIFCDKLPCVRDTSNEMWQTVPSILRRIASDYGAIYIVANASTVNSFKQWLSQNPVTVQYELQTPVIKTVDLSSSGNWDKVVLDGSEEWLGHASWSSGDFLAIQTPIPNKLSGGLAFTDSEDFKGMSWKDSSVDSKPSKECVRYDSSGLVLYVFIKKSRLANATIDEFKQWLSNNPITVWYQTATHQDSTNVKEMLSFANGHIQLASQEGSLIPSLSYEVPTSNSYYLDLAKSSTKYTMKNMQGTFTIDGTQYNASTNGTFTTPSSMTDKLMITSVAQNEAMIIEGDVTSKDVSYFKGIKSAFEGEDKIEVLSTGKNLPDQTKITENKAIQVTANGAIVDHELWDLSDYIQINPTKVYFGQDVVTGSSNYGVALYDKDKKYIASSFYGSSSPYLVYNDYYFYTKNLPLNARFIRISLKRNSEDRINRAEAMFHEASVGSVYEPYKSNSTKIPLLSPLRSLPNGVKDELAIDRNSNKVKLIQRVGKVVLDGSSDEGWAVYTVHAKNVRIQKVVADCLKGDNISPIYATCDKLPSVVWHNSWTQDYNLITFNVGSLFLQLSDTSMVKEQMLSWLTRNPITVYYQLATPVITEVNLDGYPYIYKDGHVFLNTDIAPTSEIKYSINQAHQIEASNEDLMRHEEKITNLHKLIGVYVNVEYESTLLALALELK